jgi:hypothetical protein
MPTATSPEPPPQKVSDQLQAWLEEPGEKTLGDLIDVFAEKSFAVLFIVLLALPALPLPTGGATHLFEVIAALLAVQLIAGREEVWLPERWRQTELAKDGQRTFVDRVVRTISWLERLSRPRLRGAFRRRASNRVFGFLVLAGCTGAFFAPPFSGLDTLPALGVVVISLGVLVEDLMLVLAGIVICAVGIALEIILGKAALEGIGDLI